jgi:hypothetical protein
MYGRSHYACALGHIDTYVYIEIVPSGGLTLPICTEDHKENVEMQGAPKSAAGRDMRGGGGQIQGWGDVVLFSLGSTCRQGMGSTGHSSGLRPLLFVWQ